MPLGRVIAGFSRPTVTSESSNEKHIPTVKNSPCPDARISSAHENIGWPEGDQQPAGEGTQAPRGVTPVLQRYALRPRARLTGPTQFQALLISKPAARSGRFTVHAIRNQKPFARLGIIAGKRIVQHSVTRNFLKRLIRETFRHYQRELGGYDVLVRVRRSVARTEAGAARTELTSLLIGLAK